MRFIVFLTITIVSLLVSSERVVSGPIGIRMDETIRLGSAFGLTIDMDTAFAQKDSLGPIFRERFRLFKDLTPQNLSDYSRQYPTEFWPLNNYLHNLYRNGLITAENLTTYRAASVRGLKYYLDAYQRTLPSIVAQPTFDASIDLLESTGIEPIEDLDSRKHAFQFERPEESLAPITVQIPLRVIEPINDLDNHKHIFQFDKPEEPPAPVPTQTPELDRFLEIAKDVASGKTIEDSVETKGREVADHFISSKVQSYLSERFKTARLNGRLFSGDGDSEVSFGLVTSLSDTDTSTLFNQLDVTARDDATLASVGFGYRTQLERSTFLGVNGFIDHDIPNDHTRASIGLEWKDTYVSLTANQYVPLSDYQTITKHESQRPAEGFDVDLEVTTPEWPLSVTYRTALWDLGDRGQNRIKAYGLKGNITDELNLQVENIESSQTSPSIMSKLTYTYRFDGKNVSVLPDPSLFESTRYQFVVRDQTMPMATKIANQPPVANNSTLSVTTGSTNSIDVTSLISDPDGDPLTTSIVVNPSHGSATLNGNVITYTHDGSSAITDSLTYQVEDGYGGTDTGIIAINRNNLAPIASDAAITIAENSSGIIDLSTLISDGDGDAMTISITSAISYGTSILSGTTVTVTPDSLNPSTTDTFTYSVSDGNGGTATGTVTVNFDRILYASIFAIEMHSTAGVTVTDCTVGGQSFVTGVAGTQEPIPWFPTQWHVNQPIQHRFCIYGQNLADGDYDSGDLFPRGFYDLTITDNGDHTEWNFVGSFIQTSFGDLIVSALGSGQPTNGRYLATTPTFITYLFKTDDGIVP